MTPYEYWKGDRNKEIEDDLHEFTKKEFKGVFAPPDKLELGKALDIIRAYAWHIKPDDDIKSFHFRLRGDVVVVTVTEEN